MSTKLDPGSCQMQYGTSPVSRSKSGATQQQTGMIDMVAKVRAEERQRVRQRGLDAVDIVIHELEHDHAMRYQDRLILLMHSRMLRARLEQELR